MIGLPEKGGGKRSPHFSLFSHPEKGPFSASVVDGMGERDICLVKINIMNYTASYRRKSRKRQYVVDV